MMGLLPLEFSDCLLDSPYFRENLKAHEKQLEVTATEIKGIEKDISEVVDAAKVLSRAKRNLATSLANFQFDCLGTSLTDDEVVIANSLKEFSKFVTVVEDETDRMLEHSREKFVVPLETFRKEQVGSVRKVKKEFEKQTAKFCAAQDKFAGMSSKQREETLAEAAEAVRQEQRNLNQASLEYVYLMHVVQERKKIEFVEAILSFMQSWATYYKHGHAVTSDFAEYMNDLKSRVQKTRGNFSTTVERYDSLRQKMQMANEDPGLLNKMYTRQGYLYVQKGKKNSNIKIIGPQWTKYYCQYQAKTKVLTMIPYNQLNGKITNTEAMVVQECVCKDESDKFRFVVSGEDQREPGSSLSLTFQALSEFERKHWVEALGGTWPAMNTILRTRADSVEDQLNASASFIFLKECLAELESRGLSDQGLYRVGGVVSKVKKLLNQGGVSSLADVSVLSGSTLDLSDPKQCESKTIASAIKQFFRDMPKPLMTFHLYDQFVEAVKLEDEEERFQQLQLVVRQLPVSSREMLKVLIRHLNKVAANSSVNLMTAGNLGVIFGPNLLRPREETVASIMDIKFCNEVIEILIDNCDRFFPVGSIDSSSPEVTSKNGRKFDDLAEEDTPDHPSLPRSARGCSTPTRTNSASSSFSHLSTNSLPDIKEFKPVQAQAKQMQSTQEKPKNIPHFTSTPVTTIPKKTSFPLTSKPLQKSATQDFLMASLEMMNSLAADLPSAPTSTYTSSLKRSLTLNSSKPPLPKHSLNTLSDLKNNLSPSSSLSSNSDTCNSSAGASPRPSMRSDVSARDTGTSANEFLARLQAEQRQRRQQQQHLDVNSVKNTKKYRRVGVAPLALPEPIQIQEGQQVPRVSDENDDDDEVVSVVSSSDLDSDLTTSVASRYDNNMHVKEPETKTTEIEVKSTRGEDGDDEAEASETSSVSDRDLCGVDSNESDHYHHRSSQPDLILSRLRSHSQGNSNHSSSRINRESAYENVRPQRSSVGNQGQARKWDENDQIAGMTSIRGILASASSDLV